VGSSNFAGLHISQAQFSAKERHFLGLVSEQSLYNLVDRMIELEVVPTCREFGLGIIPYSPLSGGLLGGVLQKNLWADALQTISKRKSKKTPISCELMNLFAVKLAWNLRM